MIRFVVNLRSCQIKMPARDGSLRFVRARKERSRIFSIEASERGGEMNTSFELIMERRLNLKKMRKMAMSLPQSSVRDDTIQRIDVELLYLKLYLNCAY